MPGPSFLPRRLDRAFSRLALPEAAKSLLVLPGNPEYISFWDDFLGTRSGTWPAGTPYASTVGVGTEVIGISSGFGGRMSVATGVNNGDTAGQGVGLNWRGDEGVYFIARLQIDRITTAKFEIGLTDAVDDDGAVLVKATPSFTATDCALFVFDTTDDTEVTFVSNGGTTDANQDFTDFDIAAAAYFIVEIVVQGDFAQGYINGKSQGSGGNIEGGNLLTPWVYAEALSGASVAVLVDYWGCIGPRFAI